MVLHICSHHRNDLINSKWLTLRVLFTFSVRSIWCFFQSEQIQKQNVAMHSTAKYIQGYDIHVTYFKCRLAKNDLLTHLKFRACLFLVLNLSRTSKLVFKLTVQTSKCTVCQNTLFGGVLFLFRKVTMKCNLI